MNKQEIILLYLNEFANWEGAFIAPALQAGLMPGRTSKYRVKSMSLDGEPVVSIGGLRLMPDYSIATLPPNHAGLILIGGNAWFTPEAKLLLPIIEQTIVENKLLAAICNASVFLGMHGFLNNIKHTSNGIDYLKQYSGNQYTGDNFYINEQAVRNGFMVTANGTGYLQMYKEVLHALEADTPELIEECYQFYKQGFCALVK